MLKKIQFKLIKIKYAGKSIGDNIRVNIEILDKTLQMDRRIKVGQTIELAEEIGSFPADQKSFAPKTKITITEKDALFNDTNNTEGVIKVDMVNFKPQNFVFIIELREKRFWKNWGKSIAKVEVTIEALVMEAIKYIPDIDNGWLKVKMADDDITYLPAFLKVQSEYIEKGREYFKILEGSYKDQKASVSLNNENNNNSRFLSDVKHEPLAKLQYSISQKKLIIGNKKYTATDYAEMPWKKGWYDIELPDYPHKDRRNYVDIASRAKTWFRIGHEGDKYLHTGSRSLGCITITEIEKWDEIYNKLIKARKGDFLSVGVLEVVD
ncbi:MAG: hypothetical protein C0412_16525 [Flavobacterium sp.]|nr:hypothetical protein [Flavobacterium sp.]